jgi:diguanylate cyclase (GGDEF)-like protein
MNVRPRVLAVEDDPAQVGIFRRIFASAGVEFRACDDPELFLETVCDFGPDLVLMDVELPGRQGPELVAELRRDERWGLLPVIFATGHRDDETRLAAARVAADSYLTKPLSPEILLATVSAHIDRWRQVRTRIERDSLTGLLGHAAFFERVEAAASRPWNDAVMTLVMLDLDLFKDLNDTLGHAAGDAHLVGVANVLRSHWPEDEAVIGRVGGDEFALLVDGSAADVQNQLEALRIHAIRTFRQNDIPGPPRFTAGVAELVYGRTAHEWREEADLALYATKRQRTRAVAGGGVW